MAAGERVQAEEGVRKPGETTEGSLKDGRRLRWMTAWPERQREASEEGRYLMWR